MHFGFSMHITQIGVGRVGRPTVYSILCARLAETITVCDTQPGLASAAYLVKHRYFGENHINLTVEQGYEVGRPSRLFLKTQCREGKTEIFGWKNHDGC